MSYCSDYIIANHQYYKFSKITNSWSKFDSKGKKLNNIMDVSNIINNRGLVILFDNGVIYIVDANKIKKVSKEDYIIGNSIECDFLNCKYYKDSVMEDLKKLNKKMSRYLNNDKWFYIYNIIYNILTNKNNHRVIIFNRSCTKIFLLLMHILYPIINKVIVASDGRIIYKQYDSNLCIFGEIKEKSDINVYKSIKSKKILVLLCSSNEFSMKDYMYPNSEIFNKDKKLDTLFHYDKIKIRGTIFNAIINSCLI
jgi:hypothetical protein